MRDRRHEAGPARLSFASEAALVSGVLARNPTAMAELHARFAQPMLRILARILGPDADLADVHHDAFVRALQALPSLRDPQALPAWMSAVAVRTARATIERRVRRRRWLLVLGRDNLPEREATEGRADDDARQILRDTYAALASMPTEERTMFALRFIDGMELTELAEVCEVSLATVKRKLARAQRRFSVLARHSPALSEYLQGDERWTDD
jgi:RNA polymerase sigma-70 factor (ECF subfamily)